MAWTFVGVSNVVEVTATSHALVTTGITGLAAGDLMIACISSRIASTTSVTLPTGWTLVSEQKNNNTLATGSALPSGVMAYHVRGASNPALTFTHPVAPNVAIGRIVAYRGVDTALPKDTQTSFTTATAQTAVSGTGLTTTLADDLIVAMAAGGQEAAWSAFNATSPSGASGTTSTATPTTTWLERADSLTTTGNDTSLAIFDAIKTAAGATGNLTATASVSAGHVVVAGAFKLAQPATADAWNYQDKSASITLSDSDKTATTVSGVVGIRSTTAHPNETAGLYYAEFLLTNVTDGIVAVGINNLTGSLVTSTGPSFHVRINEGAVYANNVFHYFLAGGDSLVSGDIVSVAWDSGTQKAWFRVNDGYWNSGEAGDPATGFLGVDCSFAAAVDHALWFTTTGGVRVVTLRTEAAEFTQSPPSGFTSWMGEALSTNVTGTLGITEAADTIAAAGTVEGGEVLPITGTLSLTEANDAIAAAGTANFPDAWNAGDKSSNITLSNNGKTATLSSAVTGGVRSTQKYLNGTETQKLYAEFVLTNAISGFSCQVGLRETGVALNTSAGSTFQCATNSGNIVIGSSTTVGNIGGAPLLDGDTVCLAWSPSTERGWFRKNSGLWNNDAAANPATNTNGLDISALNNTDHALLFLAASSLNGAIVTVRTESSELVYTAPAGFVSWMGESLAGSITGTLSITEADDTIAAQATVTVTGTLSVTEANDTIAATGGLVVGGALSQTEADDTISATAIVALVGALSLTEANDTLAAAGTVEAVASITGTLNVTEANDAIAAAGTTTVSGTLNVTEANDTLTALATITIGSALNVTESNDTLSSAGTVSDYSVVIGTLDVTESSDTLSALATVTGEAVVPPVFAGGGYYAPPRFARDGHADGAMVVVNVRLVAGRATGSSNSVEQSIVVGLRCVDGAVAGNATAHGSMRTFDISLRTGFASGEVNISEAELLILAEAA